MPEKTVIDIVDTAVKIGLGALITGFTGYLIAKVNGKNESIKEYEQRHRNILEFVAENVEETHHAYLKYWALVQDWQRYERQGKQWPNGRAGEYEIVNKELMDVFKSLSAAEAKLLLIDEVDAYNSLREYAEAIIQFKKDYYFNKQKINVTFMNDEKLNIKRLRETFLRK